MISLDNSGRYAQFIFELLDLFELIQDSLLCIWDWKGQLISKREPHPSSAIWCVDYDPLRNLIFTGGGDSAIRISMPSPMSPNGKMTSPPLGKAYCLTLLDDSCCFVILSDGQIFLVEIPSSKWKHVGERTGVTSIDKYTSKPSIVKIVLGCLDGLVCVLSFCEKNSNYLPKKWTGV